MSVISGVQNTVQSRLTPDEGKLLTMAEHFDQFIVAWEMKHPSVWRDRIPKGVFPLFQGLSQKTNIFRGTLGPQQGLADWVAIEPSQKPVGTSPGKDYCTYNPQTYTWSYESMDFTGSRTSWRSPSFCVNDLKFIDKAKEQLGFIIRAGSQVTDMVKETFNREQYVKTAVDAGRGIILCEGGLDYVDDSTVRFSYDPTVVDANSNTYVTFAASLLPKLSTLNWTYLDFIRQYMADQCPDAAMGSESGMPIFGLMLDIVDFEKFVLTDNDLREDFRYARPQELIKGFDMGFKVYRGFTLIHDVRQMRFKVTGVTATTATATRVVPRRATRPGTVGYIPETNPDYIKAEIGMGIIFMNDVLQILVPPTLTNFGSGMTFGPAPDYNGTWAWLNIQDEETNPLNEFGYFFARFEYFVKPMQWASEATVFLYRRCPQALRTVCAIEDEDDVGAGAVALGADAASADFDGTLDTVSLTMSKKLAGGVGSTVTIVKADTTSFTATIFEDCDAPTYVFGWVSGCSNEPTAYTDFTVAGGTTVTVS